MEIIIEMRAAGGSKPSPEINNEQSCIQNFCQK